MALLDGDLAAVFGAAFGAVFADGMLHKITRTDTGTGGFSIAQTDYPVKLSPATIGAAERVTSGIPANATKASVLRAGLPVSIDLDDGLFFGGSTYRVIGVGSDPAGAVAVLTLVPT